jgi:hypothetical protein
MENLLKNASHLKSGLSKMRMIRDHHHAASQHKNQMNSLLNRMMTLRDHLSVEKNHLPLRKRNSLNRMRMIRAHHHALPTSNGLSKMMKVLTFHLAALLLRLNLLSISLNKMKMTKDHHCAEKVKNFSMLKNSPNYYKKENQVNASPMSNMLNKMRMIRVHHHAVHH